MVWVLSGDAPVADVNEYAVLGAMADKADPDGCGSWLSKETIATRVHISEETVKRCWRNMLRRKLIVKGDQSLVRHYRADRRPVVYDLLIPFDWFSNVDRVNAERARLGREPLTLEDRPAIAPPPAKKPRVDKGTKKPRKQSASERGNSETPRSEGPDTQNGGTTSRRRGNYESSTGELRDPQYSPVTPSTTETDDGPPVRPSVPAGGAREAQANGRTDGRGGGIDVDQKQGPVPAGGNPAAAGALPGTEAATGPGGAPAVGQVRVSSSPGVELLLNIGAWRPEFLLTGPALRDQGLMVTGLIEAGWPREHLRQVIAGRPLPDPLHRTVGAIVSGRLRAAAAMPVPHPNAGGAVPHQASAPDLPWTDQPPTLTTPTPPAWSERQEQHAQLRRGADAQRCCDGDDGMCPKLAVVGEALCPDHLGWLPCSGGCTRRTRDGAMCATCTEQMQLLSAEAIKAEPTDDGTCPGHDGAPCGRSVVTLGLCRRCRVLAQADRDRVEAEWRAAAAAAVAAAETAEAEEAHAPF